MFLTMLAAGLIVLAVAAAGAFLLYRPLLNRLADTFSRLVFSEPYYENILEMVNVASKIGPMDLAELELRSESGKPVKRPFGARRVISPWDRFFFSPVYIASEPLPASVNVDDRITIGPRAGKPLKLGIPLLIGGMAWGNALSSRAKIALAMGATMAGTATNTGQGPFLPAEREAAGLLVIQITRAGWMREPDIIRQADAIEITLGHGATACAARMIPEQEMSIDPEFRAALAGAYPQIGTTLPEGSGPGPLRDLVAWARETSGGVPVGVKIGATDRLEGELAAIMSAEPDFITVDGQEGGTHGVGTALHDGIGLPTLYALCRSDRFLRMSGSRERVSLIICGGLYQPANFLKALALGADAVYTGTGALLAATHGQAEKATPYEPPTQLVFHRGKMADKYDPAKGAKHLARYLGSCVAEMNQVAQVIGRAKLSDIGRGDLCCLESELAIFAGVRWAAASPAPEDS